MDDTGAQARELCDQRAQARGSKCSIFAIGREIVWDGPVSYLEKNSDYIFTFIKPRGHNFSVYSGVGNIIERGRKIAIRVGQCRGEADLKTKKWFIKSCKNDYSAYGTFVAGEGNEKYYGIGRSNSGISVDMKLLVPSSDAKISKTKVSTYSPDTSFEKGVLARIEAAKLETEGESLVGRPLANKSNRDICNGLKYEAPNYVEEAKRRGIGAKDCVSTVKSETKISKEKISTPTPSNSTKKAPRDLHGRDTYSLSLQWEGIHDLLAGTIHYPKKRDRTFIARLSGEGFDCAGSYTFSDDRTTGVWNLACANQRAASGTFKMNDTRSSGTGVDPKGHKVKYTVSRR